MEQNELLDRIEREVSIRQPADFHLQVVRNDVRRDGTWWHVVVTTDRPGVRASRYNAIVQEIEEVMEDEVHEKVLLIPALVD